MNWNKIKSKNILFQLFAKAAFLIKLNTKITRTKKTLKKTKIIKMAKTHNKITKTLQSKEWKKIVIKLYKKIYKYLIQILGKNLVVHQ